jgi:N-acetylmuramate 1-kinase
MSDTALDQWITWTRSLFPEYAESNIEIVLLEKGGGQRLYYRIRFNGTDSVILVKYNPDRIENLRFVAIANFLNEIGANAPRIFHHDAERCLIWTQDLGEEDLWHHRSEPWDVRERHYRAALDQVSILHRVDQLRGAGLRLQPGFDEGLYRWEQNYCFDNCFGRCFGLTETQLAPVRSHAAFGKLAKDLAAYPRAFIHRDFQSQNIILHNNEAYLIDFQGMRLGLPQYDLASVLYDPYVSLTEEERWTLVGYYWGNNRGDLSLDEFKVIYLKCALQRLMQALGAYGFISLVGKKPEFLRHIEPARKSLIAVASSLEEFRFFAGFLAELPQLSVPPRV